MLQGLSRALLEAKRSSSFKYIKVGRSSNSFHLLFVNDILLFCDGFVWDAMKLKEILDLCYIATCM
jgi:hypothetical protein